jgi:hypothetical protein
MTSPASFGAQAVSGQPQLGVLNSVALGPTFLLCAGPWGWVASAAWGVGLFLSVASRSTRVNTSAALIPSEAEQGALCQFTARARRGVEAGPDKRTGIMLDRCVNSHERWSLCKTVATSMQMTMDNSRARPSADGLFENDAPMIDPLHTSLTRAPWTISI